MLTKIWSTYSSILKQPRPKQFNCDSSFTVKSLGQNARTLFKGETPPKVGHHYHIGKTNNNTVHQPRYITRFGITYALKTFSKSFYLTSDI